MGRFVTLMDPPWDVLPSARCRSGKGEKWKHAGKGKES
jgi:hypothetical protein